MHLINWLNLQPQQADLEWLEKNISKPMPVRAVCQNLIELTLQGYPWEDRPDTVPSFHPSNIFNENQWIALPVHDAQKNHPFVWQIAQVKKAEMVENPVQGSFQVLVLDIYGKQIQLACGIPDAPFSDSILSQYSPQDLTWLIEWIEEVYFSALQSVLANLVSEGKLRGSFAGDMYVPDQHKIDDNKEKPTLTGQPTFYQRILNLLMEFLKRLFGRKP